MKSGSTLMIVIASDIQNIEAVGEAIFTLNGAKRITKRFPSDSVGFSNGMFSIALTQEETMELATDKGHMVNIEAQVNFVDKSVTKTETTNVFIAGTLATEYVDGNYPGAYTAAEITMKFLDGVIVAQVDNEKVDEAVARADRATEDAVKATGATVSATNAARDATSKAKSATENAKNATIEAQSATSNAILAIQSAETATTNAQNATTDAINATSDARKAIADTEDVIDDANSAISGAEKATTDARKAIADTNAVIEDAIDAIADAEKLDITAERVSDGVNVSITRRNGTETVAVKDGKDYVVTDQDLQDIADRVEAEYAADMIAVKKDVDQLSNTATQLVKYTGVSYKLTPTVGKSISANVGGKVTFPDNANRMYYKFKPIASFSVTGITSRIAVIKATEGEPNDICVSNSQWTTKDYYGETDGSYVFYILCDFIDEELTPTISTSGEIADIRKDVATLDDRIDNIDTVIIETVEPLQKQADDTQRSLEALWKINEGQTYDFEEKTERGMSVAPTGAMFSTLEEVYGESKQQTYNGYQLADTSFVIGKKLNDVAIGTKIYTATTFSLKNEKVHPVIKFTDGTTLGGNMIVTFVVKSGSQSSIPYDGGNITNAENITAINFYTNATGISQSGDKVIANLGLYTIANSEYEPFVGNIPSPNPQYPQEIHSITDINVTVASKNLFDKESAKKGYFWSYAADVNTPSYSTSGGVFASDYISIPSNVTSVTVTTYLSKLGVACVKPFVAMGDTGNITGVRSGDVITCDGSKQTYTYTIPKGVKFITITADESHIDDIQVEFGDSATDYVPYEEQTHSITPPFPMNAITSGDNVYRDMLDVDNVVWVQRCGYKNISITLNASAPNINFGDVQSDSITSSDRKCMANNYTFGASGEIWNTSSPKITVQANGNIRIYDKKPLGTIVNSDVVYVKKEEQTFPIDAEDLAFLNTLELLSTDHTITITDQDGNDVSYLLEYIINLKEVQ